ncbi:MAG: phosphoglycerate kinase [Dehalococcoidia bacterium]
MNNKKNILEVDFSSIKRVLLRVDFNIPLDISDGKISDDSRILASIPTIKYLLQQSCAILICSHFGRPNGSYVEEFKLDIISSKLSELLGQDVTQLDDCIGIDVEEFSKKMQPGEIAVLQNLRFHSGEEENESKFAEDLSKLADLYVNDAFGVAHRNHASMDKISNFIPMVAGLLLKKEIDIFSSILQNPERPLLSVFGGAKVSDKLRVIENLSSVVDVMIIGGAMSAPFLILEGLEIGDSLVEQGAVESVEKIMESIPENSCEIILPDDFIVSDSFSENSNIQIVDKNCIPSGWRIMDIGPKSVKKFIEKFHLSKTLIWNGPMGVFEWQKFSSGTKLLAQAMTSLNECISIVGGGSTVEAISFFGLSDQISHISTGGGASISFLEGSTLPGIKSLLDN